MIYLLWIAAALVIFYLLHRAQPDLEALVAGPGWADRLGSLVRLAVLPGTLIAEVGSWLGQTLLDTLRALFDDEHGSTPNAAHPGAQTEQEV